MMLGMVSIKTYHEGDDKCVSECTMPEKMDKEEKKHFKSVTTRWQYNAGEKLKLASLEQIYSFSYSAPLSKCSLLLSCAHLADPVWHCVSARGAVVGVDNNDSDDDGCNDKHHGEEHVLPNEWYSARGRWDQLHNDQQEHSQRQQDRNAEGHLLTWKTPL